MLPVELPLVDGTGAVKEIRGPGFVTCVCSCLGSPCFNKHLGAERGPALQNTAQIAAHTRDCCQCVCLRLPPPPQVSHRCISAPPVRFSRPARRPGPRFTALTQESIKGCLGIPGPSLSESSFIIAASYHARGAARQSTAPPHVFLVSAMAERLKWLLHTSPLLTFMEKMAL